jgi:hypothetical protein
MHGSLTIGHNGSYMPMVANNVCSCVVVIYCSHNNKYVAVTWLERAKEIGQQLSGQHSGPVLCTTISEGSDYWPQYSWLHHSKVRV